MGALTNSILPLGVDGVLSMSLDIQVIKNPNRVSLTARFSATFSSPPPCEGKNRVTTTTFNGFGLSVVSVGRAVVRLNTQIHCDRNANTHRMAVAAAIDAVGLSWRASTPAMSNMIPVKNWTSC